MIKLYNSVSRQVEEFISLKDKEVGIYACGPTVYNYAHIGNLRTYVFEDLLKRVFLSQGYKVKHIMNITDVGHLTDDGDLGVDKMSESSKKEKKSPAEIADFYTKAFFKDTDRLNILRPDVSCFATQHIEDMINLIKKLEEGGYTYFSGGNVYFDIAKFKDYGKMAQLDKQELMAGARICVDKNKKNPNDFVLWFTKSKFENHILVWDSPWGVGYPGWHIECSAMSMKYLGDTFDIHCGGVDHISVHHTNEIAQSEAATGKTWVNYWIHGEFLILDKGKMSKSSGKFLTLQSLIDDGYSPLDYRFFCLGAHYRSQLKFSYQSLDAAKNARLKLNNRVLNLKKSVPDNLSDNFVVEKYCSEFFENVKNDLDLPKALAVMWALLKDNSLSAEQILSTLYKIDAVLGLGLKELEADENLSDGLMDENEIRLYIQKREDARKNKKFDEADKIRDLLLENGVILKDAQEGTTFFIKKM